MSHDLKVVVAGDGGVGKTSLLITYTTNKFPQEYIPTVFDSHNTQITHKETTYNVCLLDTGGHAGHSSFDRFGLYNAIGLPEDYNKLRTLSYPLTNVFLLCYSVEISTSLSNVTKGWLEEIKTNCPCVPIVLVACKIDLRMEKINCTGCAEFISYEDGVKVAKENNLYFVETSSCSGLGLKELFKIAIDAAINYKRNTARKKGIFGRFRKIKQKAEILPPIKVTEENEKRDLKIVVVGDDSVGKTSLLNTYTANNFPMEHLDTVLQNCNTPVMYKRKIYNLGLWDSSAQEDFIRRRPLMYPGADVVIVCYSIERRDSLKNVTDRWLREINNFCSPGAPVVLVACKKDLRVENTNCLSCKKFCSHEDGAKIAKENSLYFIETSSLNGSGVKELFELAIDAALTNNKPKTKNQSIFRKLFNKKEKS